MNAARPRRGGFDEGARIGRATADTIVGDQGEMFAASRGAYGNVSIGEPPVPQEIPAAGMRDRGIRRISVGRDASANDAWRSVAEPKARRLARTRAPFTAEDVRGDDVDEPPTPGAWGALFNSLARAGVIRQVGWTTGRRPESHGRGIRVWQGTSGGER